MSISLIVLAAGRGTRMQSDRPKVLHEIAHAPLFQHALAAGMTLAPDRIVLVAGHGAAEVQRAAERLDPRIEVVLQEEQRGTAHAVAQAGPALEGVEGDAFVLYGDTPFIRPETLQAMSAARADGAALVVLGFEAADPGRYGRIVAENGDVARIVEWKDATEAERAIRLCNSGVICADASLLFELVAEVRDDNAAGEFYLTDIVGLARGRGLSVRAVTCPEAETLGINTRAELAAAEAAFQTAARARAMAAGVTLMAPETAFFAHDTEIGADTIVEPNVVFGPGVRIAPGAHIRAFSHLEGAQVAPGAVVGPYARLRPGAEISKDARIGNFVEIKSAEIGAGAKVNHLSYVGDAVVGAGANLGAGTVTCNYDGVFKHRTEIGANAFIGSSTMLVAPVRVGAEAMTASGSVVTGDVPEGALALARARQVNKPGLARRLMERLRALKAARSKGTS
ncbi:UDP-N-acetylglucosamine pyrophosphorylase /glucosamine-1-phosphate N-acetyltransferase [Palleronia aestuarii]|uniref:Bifunctional protein GlmU n=1 Tax=Palleronia aestuarii TaxID=568105 RepID=A0A2W7Q794_9RHOB|nr:bifunctional UDP-N-acetylglucosamine diphosphorylase/glucosamine-1-phosphate N-acetyltransferase GlmU [Palleronia aestuarii]PZX17649.1 UDP-N-acetylglucosamine pyrophosphorylase /glucosamine-1-phosphate N-acetyltransferase [Palleronia aestuarii]